MESEAHAILAMRGPSSAGLDEAAVIRLMRRRLKRTGFKAWRNRVSGRTTKHVALRSPDVRRAYCPTQYKRY